MHPHPSEYPEGGEVIEDISSQLQFALSEPPEFDPLSIPVRQSNLKLMARSPAHYLHGAQHGIGKTNSLEHGAAVDAMVYGTQPVLAYPGAVRRGAEYEAFRAEHPGAIILTRTEYDRAAAVARALQRNELAARIRDGQRQQEIRWQIDGRDCIGTPDAFSDEHVSDLKTCESSAPERFVWNVRRYAYHAQLAWYRNGLLLSGRANPQACYLVAVESRPPHVVTVFRLTERTLEQGTRAWRLWWERLRVCEQTGEWPGYAQTDVDLDIDDAEDGFSLRIEGEEVEI